MFIWATGGSTIPAKINENPGKVKTGILDPMSRSNYFCPRFYIILMWICRMSAYLDIPLSLDHMSRYYIK